MDVVYVAAGLLLVEATVGLAIACARLGSRR